ncbi:MAG: class I SAM-dependent methyltransferase [Acidobacteria bacterium]|nr:class I SAM-dependent methyltransferase [Acidobacteriota bacterium]
MTPRIDPQPDPAREKELKARLREYLVSIDQPEPDRNVEELFAVPGGFGGRFEYFTRQIPPEALASLLVSGCAVGSEALVGRQYGFATVTGTEVTPVYVEIARERFAGVPGFAFELYDGDHLPFPDRHFTAIASGHIIEHTRSPFDYLTEHLRVLRPGGFFFLEFPNRYHLMELHTNLPSVEYLPGPLRMAALRFLASSRSPVPPPRRKGYQAILGTDLKPMSVWQIKKYLRDSGIPGARIVHRYTPAPGFVRMVIAR